MTLRSHSKGFTLIELLMVIMLTGILATVGVYTIGSGVDQSRFDGTFAEMQAIRDALVGNTEIKENGVRDNFGYLGDIGRLPTNAQGINALISNPGVPAWNVNTTSRFALGWNGPYVTSGPGTDFTRDAWGRPYIVNLESSPATITSRGADGLAGGTGLNTDIVIQIPAALQTATVYGFISNGGNPYAGAADIDLYYPSNGTLATAQRTIAASANGAFSFTNIPLGKRSAMIYVPNRTSPTATIGPFLFTVDTNNYVIPAAFTNGNPTGTGGGLGGTEEEEENTPAHSCATNAGRMSLHPNANAVSVSGNRVTVDTRVTNAAPVVSMRIIGTSTTSVFNVVFDGAERKCETSSMSPCPAVGGIQFTLSPSASMINGQKRPFAFQTTTAVPSGTKTYIQFNYASGCDVIEITIP